MDTPLTKENCKISKSEKGNLYITHPQFKVKLRLYAEEAEIAGNPDWRKRIALREGTEGSFYAVLAKSALVELDY